VRRVSIANGGVISEAAHKLLYGRACSRGLHVGISVILLSFSTISAIFRSYCDQIGGNNAEVSPLVFTDGEDTAVFGGTISANRLQVRFSGIRLAVESDIVITQLVNITNIGFLDCALDNVILPFLYLNLWGKMGKIWGITPFPYFQNDFTFQ